MRAVLKDARRGQQRAGKPFATGQRKPTEWENLKQVEEEEIYGPLAGGGYASMRSIN